MKDNLDRVREIEEEEMRQKAEGTYVNKQSTIDTSFEGHGTLIVAKDTISDHSPLCLSLGNDGNRVRSWLLEFIFQSNR